MCARHYQCKGSPSILFTPAEATFACSCRWVLAHPAFAVADHHAEGFQGGIWRRALNIIIIYSLFISNILSALPPWICVSSNVHLQVRKIDICVRWLYRSFLYLYLVEFVLNQISNLLDNIIYVYCVLYHEIFVIFTSVQL